VKLTTFPSSAEVKNAWSYTSTPPIYHGMVLSKHRDNFTFTLTLPTAMLHYRLVPRQSRVPPHEEKRAILLAAVLTKKKKHR